MIQLFSISINNTYECNLSISKIVTLIKVSKPSAIKYLKELIEKGLIDKTESGYRLNDRYFSTGNSKQKQILQIQKSLSGCEYLEKQFNNTDWKSIKHPEQYWLSVVAGYRSNKTTSNESETIIM